MKKVKILLVLLMVFLVMVSWDAAFATTFNTRSISSPNGEQYLGEGYDLIKEDFAGNSCLTFPAGCIETYQQTYSGSSYLFVQSKKELHQTLTSTLTSNVSGGLGDFSASNKLTKKITADTTFGTEKVTIVYYWYAVDKEIYINGRPRMNDDAMALLRTDNRRFHELYGDKYVYGMKLGKEFFIIFQGTMSSETTQSKVEIQDALEVKFKDILSGNVDQAALAEAESKLETVSINSRCYGFGVDNLGSVFSTDDFKKVVAEVTIGEPAVIGQYSKYYQTTVSNDGGYSYLDPQPYLDMKAQWKLHLGNVGYILDNENISSHLQIRCEEARDNITYELDKVLAARSDARYPLTNEFDGIYNKYLNEFGIVGNNTRWCKIGQLMNKLDSNSASLDISFPLTNINTLRMEGYYEYLYLPQILYLEKYSVTKMELYGLINGSYQLLAVKGMSPKTTVKIFEGATNTTKFRVKIFFEVQNIYFHFEPLPPPADFYKITFSCTKKETDQIWLYMNQR